MISKPQTKARAQRACRNNIPLQQALNEFNSSLKKSGYSFTQRIRLLNTFHAAYVCEANQIGLEELKAIQEAHVDPNQNHTL